MDINLHVFFHSDPADGRKLDQIKAAVALIPTKLDQLETKLMAQIDDLKAAIAAEDANIDAILALVNTELASIADLQAQLATAISNTAPDLSSIIADVQQKTAALAAALPAVGP